MNGDKKKKNLRSKYLNKYRPKEEPVDSSIVSPASPTVEQRTNQILQEEVVQGEGTLSGIKGLYGNIESYLEPGLLMGEAEELFSSTQAASTEGLHSVLGEGLDPWDWSGQGFWDKNMGDLNKGWNRGYRVEASKDRSRAESERSGMISHAKKIGEARGVRANKIDNYFYNLALTEVYQKSAESIAAAHDINPGYMDYLQYRGGGGGLTGRSLRNLAKTDASKISELKNMKRADFSEGKTEGHIFRGSPTTEKTWERYEGIIHEYAPHSMKDLQAKASAMAFQKSNEYRSFLRNELNLTADAIKGAKGVEDKKDLILTLNNMLETTGDINNYDETQRRLMFVSEQSKSLDASKILDTFKALDNANFEYDRKKVSDVYKSGNSATRNIVSIFSDVSQDLNNQKDKQPKAAYPPR